MQETILLIVTALVVTSGAKIWGRIHNQKKPMKISLENKQKLNKTRNALLYMYLKSLKE